MTAWLLAAVVAASPRAFAAENRFPKAAAAYVVQRDGKTLWEGNASRRLPPASLAKMMTALLVLEKGGLDRAVTVSSGAASETGTRLGLKAGDHLTVRDLLAAAIMRSANDACRALADDHSGTEAKFVAEMNRRAASLGMTDTRFLDACGHDLDGQYSTAADLARLAAAVAARPEYLEISKREHAAIKTADGARSFEFDNTNALIGRYAGAVGLKTGTTPRAGTCLAALAERDGVRVLMILLNSRDRWWGGDALLDRAFAAP